MKKKILATTALLFVIATAEAETGNIRGQYTYSDRKMKGVKAWIVNKQDTVRLDKKGKFRIKNVDFEKDTLQFESIDKQSIVVPLQGNSIVKIERDEHTTAVHLSKEERRPTSTYGGTIYTKAELEQTGETFALNAVLVKSPQKAATSFFMSNKPLYFVDGVEVASLDIPVKEVAFVEVVKATNATSSAFGVRGANGAILVTTDVKWKSADKGQ